MPLHWHLEMEIIYIKKGCGAVSIDLSSSLVKEGDIILIAPGQLHSISQQEDIRMEYENILFDLSMLEAKGNDSCTADFLPLCVIHTCLLKIFILLENRSTKKSPIGWIRQMKSVKRFLTHTSCISKAACSHCFMNCFQIGRLRLHQKDL